MNIHEELMQLINGMTGRIINLEAESGRNHKYQPAY